MISLTTFPTKDQPTPPIPGAELSTQVLGAAASVQSFLFGGFVVSEGIKVALELIGRPLETFRDVLDFGCGSGRVLRWFGGYQMIHWVGGDISEEALEWNRRNLGFGEFVTNGMEPPLSFEAESFDLIYAVSVVTHIDEELQFAWLKELRRILRPGGIIILTASGEEVAQWKLAPEDFREYQAKGHKYKHVQQGGLHGLPDFYQDAYHSRPYIMKEWSKYFEPLAYIRNGPMYLQDMVILERTSAHKNCTQLDLPLGGYFTPGIADIASGETLTVSGWTFQHHTGAVPVTFYMDGKNVGSTVAALPTAQVGEVFPAFPEAKKCGFSADIPLAGLSRGPHVLKLGVQGGTVPYLSTYIFVEPLT